MQTQEVLVKFMAQVLKYLSAPNKAIFECFSSKVFKISAWYLTHFPIKSMFILPNSIVMNHTIYY